MTRVTKNLIVGLMAVTLGGSSVLAGSCSRGGSCPRGGGGFQQPCPPPAAPAPFEDEFGDGGFELDLKPVDCEVQVQHPLTFDWISVQTFGDEERALAYKERIEERYWVVYRSPGSEQPEFLEASSRSDANSRTASLRRAGKMILDVKPVVAQVVEMPLLPLLDQQPLLGNDLEYPAGPPADTFDSAPAGPNDLEPLLGLWEAATQDADGNVQRLLLDLHADGSAVLTVPTAGGGEARIERPFQIENGEFKLADEENELVLGVVIEATAEQVVLERPDGRITLTRP